MDICNKVSYCYIIRKKITHKSASPLDNCYNPDETLVKFIQEWLRLHKMRDRVTLEGKDLTEGDQQKIRDSDRMKVYILDNILFPSMANLIYFFEAIASSKRLSKAFEVEVAELLDPSKAKEASQSSANDMRFSSLKFRRNNLARLISAILAIHNDKAKANSPTTDFRVGLMYQIQNVIGDMMDRLIDDEFSFGNQIWRSAISDYQRMMGWLALLARTSEDHHEKYDRKIGFSSIWWSNKASMAQVEI